MGADKKCLIVDDSKVVREITVRLVEDYELSAIGVSNAREAIEHCMSARFEAVFLDWDLPNMGALDFSARCG